MNRKLLFALCLSLGATAVATHQSNAQRTTDLPSIEITRNPNATGGEWKLNLNAASMDRGNAWVDWNNNQKYEAGEEVSLWGMKSKDQTKHEVVQKTIRIYGNLSAFKCEANEIVKIDASKHPSLAYLDCEDNQLESIDLSKNTKLMHINLAKNKLSDIQVAHLGAQLKHLDVGRNKLTAIDVMVHTNLDYLDCCHNEISKLDVTKNPKLENLFCNYNQLKELDVTQNKKLQWLWFFNNEISTLKMAEYKEGESVYDIDYLSAHHNKLEEMTISEKLYPKLQTCYLNNNRLSKFSIGDHQKLNNLNLSDNQLTSVTLGSLPDLRMLSVHGNRLSGLSVAKCPLLKLIYTYENEFPESVFQVAVKTLPSGTDKEPNAIYIIDSKSKREGGEKNKITDDVVRAFNAKYWKVYDNKNGLSDGKNEIVVQTSLDEVRHGGDLFYFSSESRELVSETDIVEIALYDLSGLLLATSHQLSTINSMLQSGVGYIAIARTADGKQLLCKFIR